MATIEYQDYVWSAKCFFSQDFFLKREHLFIGFLLGGSYI